MAIFTIFVAFFLIFPLVFVYHLILTLHAVKTAKIASSALGVGISLTVSYGTISIRHEDGSFDDVGQINGNDRYVQMMQRLSTPSAKHPSPPYNSMEDLWADWPRQLWRLSRKRLGLPASADVGILSEMLDSLLRLASSQTGQPLPQSGVISYPGIVALYNEDIVDAALHLGFVALRGHHLNQPRELVAAYTGQGMGLCGHPENQARCAQEGLALPARHVVCIEYTAGALVVQAAVMRAAIDLAEADIDAAASFELGSGRDGATGRNARLVGEFVAEFLRRRYEVRGAPAAILAVMTGETRGVGDGVVRKEVAGAIEKLGSTSEIAASMPVYVASRGAAELAWRALSIKNSI